MDQDLKLYKNKTRRTDRKKPRLNKQLLIYLFFLCIAVVFWYINALGKTYNTTLNYTVQYNNFPKGKVLISELPLVLTLKVKGPGFQIFRYKIVSLFKPLTLSLRDYSQYIEKVDSNFNYILASRFTLNSLGGIFPTLEVYGMNPDTLRFKFTTVVEKTIPLKANLDLEFEKSYMQSGIVRVIPDRITVSGPKAMIDTLKFIYTQPLKLSDLNDTILQVVNLEVLPKFIYPFSKVRVYVPVEKYTEVLYSLPIETINVPENLEIRTFPSTVNVSFNVTLSNFNKVTPYLFKAVVDYNQILENNPQKLKVMLSKFSPKADNIKFYPKNVEYIIEKW